METHHHQQHQKQIEARQEDKEAKQILLPKPSSPPPSQSSSPSHEFSFTISLHSSSTNKVPPPSLAIDLSPADEIFFHGHLLPLHLLSHLPSSPRFSTTSMESLTVPVPIRDFLLEDNENTNNKEISRSSCGHSNRSNITLDERIGNNFIEEDNNVIKRGTMEEESKSNNNNNNKHSSFSLFGLSKGRKVCQVSNKEELDKEKQQKRKLGFDVIHALKRLFRGRREREKVGLHESAYSSHSGNLMRKKKPELRGIRRGECSSAPASMRASPTNSGLLLATATTLPTSAANDSTMEELQAAIQAAIAHCKNSIAKEDNNLIKCTS